MLKLFTYLWSGITWVSLVAAIKITNYGVICVAVVNISDRIAQNTCYSYFHKVESTFHIVRVGRKKKEAEHSEDKSRSNLCLQFASYDHLI